MTEPAQDVDTTDVPTVEAVPAADAGRAEEVPAEAHEPAACPVAWCPVCLAVTVVQPIRPEVIEHLLKAGAEFFLAMKAVIDVRADELEPDDEADPPVRLEKIDLG